jgi:hypothetical protein
MTPEEIRKFPVEEGAAELEREKLAVLAELRDYIYEIWFTLQSIEHKFQG